MIPPVAAGLVERRECESDRRARFAALTRRGEKLMHEIFPEHVAAVRRAMSGLDVATQREAADALRTLGVHTAGLALAPAGPDRPAPDAASEPPARIRALSSPTARGRRSRR